MYIRFNITCNFLLGLLSLLMIGGSAFAQESLGVSATVSAEPTELHVGDHVTVTITVKAPERYTLESVEPSTEWGALEILETLPPEEKSRAGEGKERICRYTLTSFETGDMQIPSFDIRYTDASGNEKHERTAPIALTVSSLLAEDAKDIRDIKEPLTLRENNLFTWLLVSGLAALLALTGVVWYVVSRKLKGPGETETSVWEEPRPAHEIALELLDGLADFALLDRGMVMEYVTQVSEILRNYVGKRFGIDALDMTTSQLVALLDECEEVEKNTVVKIRRLLEECDLVKFAKAVPERITLESYLAWTREIVMDTKEEPVAQDNKPVPDDASEENADEKEEALR